MALGFKHPFTCTVSGPTQCGKTFFIQKLLKAAPFYITPCPQRIIWVSGAGSSAEEELKHSLPKYVEFTDTIPALDTFSPEENNLMVIDDMMHELGRSRDVSTLFTKGCHHRNLSVIITLQNLFHRSNEIKCIRLNSLYLVLYGNPSDKQQIQYLQRQCFPEYPKFLSDAYNRECSAKPHGYLVLDFTQTTPSDYRVSAGIFPPEVPRVFKPVVEKQNGW